MFRLELPRPSPPTNRAAARSTASQLPPAEPSPPHQAPQPAAATPSTAGSPHQQAAAQSPSPTPTVKPPTSPSTPNGVKPDQHVQMAEPVLLVTLGPEVESYFMYTPAARLHVVRHCRQLVDISRRLRGQGSIVGTTMILNIHIRTTETPQLEAMHRAHQLARVTKTHSQWSIRESKGRISDMQEPLHAHIEDRKIFRTGICLPRMSWPRYWPTKCWFK